MPIINNNFRKPGTIRGYKLTDIDILDFHMSTAHIGSVVTKYLPISIVLIVKQLLLEIKIKTLDKILNF